MGHEVLVLAAVVLLAVALCKAFARAMPLPAAALQFPLHHPCVASVIPGAVSAEQVRQNLELTRVVVPADFWAELKADGLLRTDAPTA